MSGAAFRRTSSRSTKPRTSAHAPEFAGSLAFSRVHRPVASDLKGGLVRKNRAVALPRTAAGPRARPVRTHRWPGPGGHHRRRASGALLPRSLCLSARSAFPLASGRLLIRLLPSSLLRRSSVQSAAAPFGSRGSGALAPRPPPGPRPPPQPLHCASFPPRSFVARRSRRCRALWLAGGSGPPADTPAGGVRLRRTGRDYGNTGPIHSV